MIVGNKHWDDDDDDDCSEDGDDDDDDDDDNDDCSEDGDDEFDDGDDDVNVNWYFLMEPSRKSHAIELSLFLWRNSRWHHWKCGYTHMMITMMDASDKLFIHKIRRF